MMMNGIRLDRLQRWGWYTGEGDVYLRTAYSHVVGCYLGLVTRSLAAMACLDHMIALEKISLWPPGP